MPIKREMMVRKDALEQTAINETIAPEPQDGEVLLEVEAFALTANNVTYAVVGEQVKYWYFFPAAEGWGIVPVWGHARVTASRHPEIAVGERVYGYLPMATHLIVEPGKISAGMFRDMAAHRQPMAMVYNQYRRLAADPSHDPARENERMLFEPLFLTSFLIDDQLRRQDWQGARTVILTSASSKTAMGLAHVARTSSPGIRRIGLTSKSNLRFVQDTGLYDQVIAYDALDDLDVAGNVVLVDFAGNAGLLSDVHARLAERLVHILKVGVTHHDEGGDGGMTSGAGMTSGPKPVWFFAPDAAATLIGAIGQDGFQRAVAERWRAFVVDAAGWVTVEDQRGPEAMQRVWRDQVAGRAKPDIGYVMRW
ncbi:DUF2855 family protein [Sphingomonas sp. So64.6b]|uniref:DUF2855 family protein n=1 Tax=Sphingomonas sp. So64.6b TaxID=2997354 RepID=UPI0016033532|nr:DUF2855 family protein [Sphingomonas sp. So64.6b]QNA86516.1 DUF2855 family protein [Sphingomonas sp. So64.6b]